MQVLFDFGHPAHVHLFRNAARQLIERGDSVVITARDRGIITHLLKHYELDYSIASTPRQGLVGNIVELMVHNWQVLKKCLKSRPDLLIGTSVSVAHVGRLIGRPSIVLNEDDADYVPLFAKITYPFASRIVIPSVLRDPKTAKVLTHESYHELAYLHPDHFTPDPGALSILGVQPGDPFFIIRVVDLAAHHDAGEEGLSPEQVEKLVEMFEPHGQVFVNSEGSLPANLKNRAFHAPPEQMHNIMAFTKLLVSDSQTMTMEAAVLGRPAFRCNTFVGRCSVIEELEQRFNLAWGYHPSQFDQMTHDIQELLGNPDLEQEMAERRAHMLEHKVNFANWILEQIDRRFA
ncbi:MAG: DUF354 domain-containing protein [Pseudomonadota bacterium]